MARPVRDLTGLKFGMLTVLRSDGQRKPKSNYYWWCKCECGNEKAIKNSHLTDGTTVSCGCYLREQAGNRARARPSHNRTHGMSGTPTHVSWSCMLRRCEDNTHPDYWRYGGSGVTVCREWHSFERFYEDMGPRPPGTTIDRINRVKGYEPGNCRWSSQSEQHKNRSNTVYLSHAGETRTMLEWSEILGEKYKTLESRRRLGWEDSKIVTTPVIHRRR